MTSPICVVSKLAELSKSAPASLEKSSWNSREVSSPYFVDLPFDMQNCISKELDDSTRMSLYLTCKALYYTPERPRMLWSEFAKAAMLEGNAELVKFGLKLEIELDYFMEYIEETARLNHRQIFEIEEIKERVANEIEDTQKSEVPDKVSPPTHFRAALAYAAKHNLFHEYKWITEIFKVSELTKNIFYIAGYLRASNLVELKKIEPNYLNQSFHTDSFPYIREQALAYADGEVIDWLLAKSLLGGVTKSQYESLGFRKDTESLTKLYNAFPRSFDINRVIVGAIRYDNVELLQCLKFLKNDNELKSLKVLKNLTFTMEDITLALHYGSFHVFEWLLSSVEWYPHKMQIDIPDGYSFSKDWYPNTLSELERHELPAFIEKWPIQFFMRLDANSFSKKSRGLLLGVDRLKSIRAPDNHQLIDLLFPRLDAALAFAIIICPQASFSQIKRVFESKWAKPTNLRDLKNIFSEYVENYAEIKPTPIRMKLLSELFQKHLSL